MAEMEGCPKIGGVEGGIGGEMAGAAVVGEDGTTGRMADDWLGRGRNWRGDGMAGWAGWRRAGVAAVRRGGGAR
jgi:hypothetical protein